MIKFGAQAGAIDEDRVVRETLGSMRCSTTGELPMGTKRVLGNRCTSVNVPFAPHIAVVVLDMMERLIDATSATSSPTWNT